MDVGIHRSVDAVFPPDRLRELIDDLGTVVVVPDERPVADCDVLSEARFVVLAVPLVETTRQLIGAEELAAMGSDAYLVNVARGPVVDQKALVGALDSNEIAGAALDVFEEEPLPPSSPLWEMGDVIVTPHAAGATRDYADRIGAIGRENYRRLDAGESLVDEVP